MNLFHDYIPHKKEILDVCCGPRMFYFDKDNDNTVYCDIRREDHILCNNQKIKVLPNIICNFIGLPFKDKSFSLIIFDPPHLTGLTEKSWIRKKYGVLPYNWKQEISDGFNECWRVLKENGTLIFKWNEFVIKVNDILSVLSQKPLLGHPTTRNLKTHWIVFYKSEQSQ